MEKQCHKITLERFIAWKLKVELNVNKVQGKKKTVGNKILHSF